MLEAGAIRALSMIIETEAAESIVSLVAAALRCLTQAALRNAHILSSKDAGGGGDSNKGSSEGERVDEVECDVAKACSSYFVRSLCSVLYKFSSTKKPAVHSVGFCP